MMKIDFIYITAIFFTVLSGFAQPNIAPAPEQSESIRIDGATIHIGNGSHIENGSISFEKGKITYVGAKDEAPETDLQIDASGKHVYPGFIAPKTNLGLVEYGAVKASVDFNETGENNAHVRSLIAYNTDSKVINTLRSNGILLAQTTPQGGLIAGQSSVVQLDAWNWEDAAYRTDDGVHINWPEYRKSPFRSSVNEDSLKQENKNKEQKLIAFLEEAKAYGQIDDRDKTTNVRLEAFKGVFEGNKNVYVHVNDVQNIQKAILKLSEMGVKPVIVGGHDAHEVAEMLNDFDVPVIIDQAHRLPNREDEDVHLPYKQAKLLNDAGVLFAYSMDGFWEQRNLAFMAGTASAFGLPYEEAVASITLNAAKILAIDDKTGSLEQGKDANLFVSDGDALDMIGNDVHHAFIQGRHIDLDNLHKQLFKKFEDKYADKPE